MGILIVSPWGHGSTTTMAVYLGRALRAAGRSVDHHTSDTGLPGWPEDAGVSRGDLGGIDLKRYSDIIWVGAADPKQVDLARGAGIPTVLVPAWELLAEPLPPVDLIVCSSRAVLGVLPTRRNIAYCPWWAPFPTRDTAPTPSRPSFLHTALGGPDDATNTTAVVSGWREYRAGGGAGALTIHTVAPISESVRGFRECDSAKVIEGAIPPERIDAIFAAADAYIYPHKWDGFGIDLLRAHAAGLAILTTDAPPLNEFAAGQLLLPPTARRARGRVQESIVYSDAIAAALRTCSSAQIDVLKHATRPDNRTEFIAFWRANLHAPKRPNPVTVQSQAPPPPAPPAPPPPPPAAQPDADLVVTIRPGPHADTTAKRLRDLLGDAIQLTDEGDGLTFTYRQKPRQRMGLRILLIFWKFGSTGGGGELTTLHIVNELYERGADVHVRYFGPFGDIPKYIDAQQSTAETWHLAVDAIKPDLIFCNNDTCRYVVPEAKRLGIPVVVYLQFWRDILRCEDKTWDAFIRVPAEKIPGDCYDKHRAAVAEADAFVANSDFTADVIRDVFGREPAAVVYPYISPAFGSAVSGDAKRSIILSPSGQVLKGARIFVELARRHPDHEFRLLAGDTVDRVEYDAPPNLRIERRWTTDMEALYAKTRLLFIGTQTAETFCRAAAEARACGIPLLTSDAGNLPRIVGDDGGVIVPRKADIDQWDEGFRRALEMRVGRRSDWCQDHIERLFGVFQNLRRFSSVAVLYPNAPGVRAALERLCDATGARPIAALGDNPLTIVPGIMYPSVPKQSAGRVAYYWCSHFSQMDITRNEVPLLAKVIEDVRQNPSRWLLTTCEQEARFWADRLGDRAAWLPVCVSGAVEKTWNRASRLDGFHVWIPGPYGERKNIFAALAACAAIKAEVHVTDWVNRQAPDLRPTAQLMGVPLHTHTCATAADIVALASRCHAGLFVSLAETYGCAVAELMAANIPCVGWAGIPAMRGCKDMSIVNDPTNIDEIVAALQFAREWPDVVAEKQREVLACTARVHLAAARETLLRILG